MTIGPPTIRTEYPIECDSNGLNDETSLTEACRQIEYALDLYLSPEIIEGFKCAVLELFTDVSEGYLIKVFLHCSNYVYFGYNSVNNTQYAVDIEYDEGKHMIVTYVTKI